MASAVALDLGIALRDLRLARGLTLDETARRCGASTGALAAWESERRRPRGPALARLLDALEADPRTKARLIHLADPQKARLALADSFLGAPVDVGTVLRVMRERRSIAQSDLARQVGTSQAAVSRWETGDDSPTPEKLHALGFALGATAEETLALASVAGAGSAGLSTVPEEARGQIWNQSIPGPLKESVHLGWEAELWRRAARDARWDACFAAVLAARAYGLVFEERYPEIAPLARRAVRLAKTTAERVEVVPAIAALADADRSMGRGYAATAELAEIWVAELPDSLPKGWMLRQRGMNLVRMGQTARGVELVSRSADMDIEVTAHPCPWSHRASMVAGAYLEAGEARQAAKLLGGRREREFDHTTFVRVEHAVGRKVTEADMAYLRFQIAQRPSQLEFRWLAKIERRQAWLKGDRSFCGTTVETLAPAPNDRETEDRLWAAVLRESRG